MKKDQVKMSLGKGLILSIVLVLMAFFPHQMEAHCDSYDGPVIQDAYKALKTEDVTPVLKWIEVKYEKEITRSEERRVGKECRYRGSAYHEKKQKTRRDRVA